MATLVRKQIYIKPDQERSLKRLAHETGATEAEIIREALDRHAEAAPLPRRDLSVWKQERAFIKELIRRGPVPADRQRSREELHER